MDTQTEKIIRDVQTLWNAVVQQGQGLEKLEALVGKIKNALNNQAQGVRNLENRVGQLEALLMRSVQTQRVPVQQFSQRGMRSLNAPPLRALPSVGTSRADFVEVDDVSADYDTDDDDQEVG